MYKVCHIVQSYYPQDPRIRRQAEALAEAGIQVDVVCLRNQNQLNNEIINGVNVIRLPLTRKRGNVIRYLFEYISFFFLSWFYTLFHLNKKYNLIHVSNLPDFLVFSAMPAKWFGCKVILDEHDPMPELFMSKYEKKADSALIKFLMWQEKISINFATHILTVNDAMKRRFEPVAQSKEVSVVMNLPDDKLFKPVSAKISNPNADNSEFILLYTGTVTDTYDLKMVVKAVSELTTIPNIKFRIVGDGNEIDNLKKLAADLNISDRVELCGLVPFSEIPKFIEKSDIGISTLKIDDLTDLCFNNKTAEYVMMGLPSVVTRTSTVQKHFPEGIVKFYEPGDSESFKNAVLELYNNPELRKQM
ncbi:MAG: glycosyltransferase family 4 protein [Armatimonadota bacterium]